MDEKIDLNEKDAGGGGDQDNTEDLNKIKSTPSQSDTKTEGVTDENTTRNTGDDSEDSTDSNTDNANGDATKEGEGENGTDKDTRIPEFEPTPIEFDDDNSFKEIIKEGSEWRITLDNVLKQEKISGRAGGKIAKVISDATLDAYKQLDRQNAEQIKKIPYIKDEDHKNSLISKGLDVLKSIGGEETYKKLSDDAGFQEGLKNNPAFVEFMTTLGKKVENDSIPLGQTGKKKEEELTWYNSALKADGKVFRDGRIQNI